MKDSIILYLSHYSVIKTLSNEQIGRLYRTIFEYVLGNEIKVDEDIKIAFGFIYNQIIMDQEKWENIKQKRSEAGKKHTGNQYTKSSGTNGTSVPTMEQNGTNGTVNVNENDNENVNVNEINNIVEFLNQLAGTKFKGNSKETKSNLKTLLKDYTPEEIKDVTKKMVDKWKNTKMEDYLRPSTLFRKSNFDNYYGLKEGRYKTQAEKNKEFFDKMKDEV